jgi:hypothetical protein
VKRIIKIAISGLVTTVILTTCGGRLDNTTSPAKNFDYLNLAEKHSMQYDSVYGNYLQWSGIQDLGNGNPKSVTRRLVFDKPNRFAIKASFDDTTGFFTKIPGDINFSGQWIESNEKIRLKFYYPPPAWSGLFDSLKNENILRVVDKVTIDLDKDAKTVWIMGTACERVQ